MLFSPFSFTGFSVSSDGGDSLPDYGRAISKIDITGICDVLFGTILYLVRFFMFLISR